MRSVKVISVIKDPHSNSETVEAVGSGAGWGAIKSIIFIAPSGKHRIDKEIRIPPVEGSESYGS